MGTVHNRFFHLKTGHSRAAPSVTAAVDSIARESVTADSSTTKAAPYSCLAKKELRLLLLLALERHKAKVIKSTVSGLESPRSSQSTKPGKEEGKADSRLRAAAPVTITVREKLIFFIYTISCIQLNVRIASHLICRFKRNFSMNTTLKKIFYWLKSHSLIPNSLSKRIFMVNSCSSLLQEIN